MCVGFFVVDVVLFCFVFFKKPCENRDGEIEEEVWTLLVFSAERIIMLFPPTCLQA